MKVWALAILPAIFIFTSCTSVPWEEYKRDDRRYVSHESRHISKKNFSLPRPKETRWYVETYKEKPDSLTYILYEKSATHAFTAEAKLINLKKAPKSKEDFKAMVSPLKQYNDKSKYEIIEKKESINERQGQWCYNYYIKCWDKKPAHYPDGKLMMVLKGFVIKHKKPGIALEAYYRNIGLVGEISEPKLNKNADAFLDSIIIEDDNGIQVN